MLRITKDVVDSIEADGGIATRQQALSALSARLGLDDFGEVLISMPSSDFPRLSRLLPAMASDAVQDGWTGNHGSILLRQTTAFVRSLAYNTARITGKDLSDKKILDFGCGYGRILRLMWYFTSLKNVWGLDPWFRSIEECKSSGIEENIALSDYLPQTLPVDETQFDLCYAFSVFTHLSEAATYAAFSAVRKHIKLGGVFLITIRPVEYWPLGEEMYGLYKSSTYIKAHETIGFAFHPHETTEASEATYGDTSMKLDWIRDNIDGWRIQSIDRSLEDPFQIYVFLTAA